MARRFEAESTRQLRRAHNSISTALYRFAHGQCDEQHVMTEMFRHRSEVQLALRRTLQRVVASRKWAAKKRPATSSHIVQGASKIPVVHTIKHVRDKRGTVPGVPNGFRYIHAICLYVIRRRDEPAGGWTLSWLVEYLATSGVVTEDLKPWTIERLTEALNPSRAWEMLHQ